jgi:hypothetical protein
MPHRVDGGDVLGCRGLEKNKHNECNNYDKHSDSEPNKNPRQNLTQCFVKLLLFRHHSFLSLSHSKLAVVTNAGAIDQNRRRAMATLTQPQRLELGFMRVNRLI